MSLPTHHRRRNRMSLSQLSKSQYLPTRIIWLLCLIVVIAASPLVKVAAQTSDDDALKIARKVVADLVKGDYDSVVAVFDDAMTKALSKDQLKTAWQGILGQEGDYQSEIAHSIQS